MKNFVITFLISLFIVQICSSQSFQIDPGHTFVNFSVNRFASVDVKGRFNDFSGTVQYDAASEMIQSASFTIDVESIDTGHDIRDGHLKGDTWLDSKQFPKITFVSKSFEKSELGYHAVGDLTIHGVTREVIVPFKLTGPAVDPTKSIALGISASISIDRQDFGISFSRLMDNGKLFIGNEVNIDIDALAVTSK